MCRYVVVLLILFNLCPAFAYYGGNNFNSRLGINRPNIIYAGSDMMPQPRCHHCSTYPRSDFRTFSPTNLSALEQYALKKNYKRESDIERIQRLENQVFGAIQEGDINSRFYNIEQAILSSPQVKPQRRSIIGNLTNFITGQPTGFTPSLTDSFMPTFNPYPTGSLRNRNYEQYSNLPFGSGWGFAEQNFNGGTSVKILD